MVLFTKKQKKQLLINGEKSLNEERSDFYPVVKLFNPYGGGTWLLSEISPKNKNIAFGLCDLGMGFPELGYVNIEELESLKLPPYGGKIERDLHFEADKPVSEYAREAISMGAINA